MPQSPQKIQSELQQEIERRISHESPTKYDMDFYLRKIARLENDFNLAHDELSKARVRLRRAEDFELKYELLMKQNITLASDLDKSEKQCHALRAKLETVRGALEDKNSHASTWMQEKRLLVEEIDRLKSKCQELEENKSIEFTTVRQNVNKQVKKEVETIKKEFSEKQDELLTQVRQLKKTIHQKQTVETVIHSKVEKIRSEKDKQITRLAKVIENKKEQMAVALKQKNDEIEKLRQKFEKMFNFEIENLRRNLDDQDEVFSIEINGLRELLGLKNEEISRLLKQLTGLNEQSELERQNLLKEIAVLKDKIYLIERQNEQEIYNIKQRLSKIQALEIEALEKQYNTLINNLKAEKKDLEKTLGERDRILELERKDVQRIKDELMDRLRERESRITQLQQRIKQSSEQNAVETKTLHESFHKIETEKESMSNEYQANVGFLNQQIAKLSSNIDIKNNEIKAMHEEMAVLKRHHAENIRELEERSREEREDREKQREKERQRRQKLEEDLRLRDKQFKARERELERAREKEEREKNKIKFICEELQRDIQRLNLYIKNLDEGLKKEMKKNQISTLDTGGVRRELTSELERQKCQLEAIKRMEVDQIRSRYELEITRLTNENEKLSTDLLKGQMEKEELEAEFKRLEHVNRNIERINKEKLVEYQKKMATLNNEILLSQNLYKSFLEAKSRQKENVPTRPA